MKKTKTAFTLIEIMVVVSIILIFTGMSLVYYNVFTQERLLNTETDKLVSVLEIAKKNSTSASEAASANCPSTYQFRGNAITFTSTKTYTISNCCAALETDATSCPDTVNTYKMKDPVNISNSPSTISFDKLYGTATAMSIIVRLGTGTTNSTKCYTVTVSSVGVVTKSNMGRMNGASNCS